MNIYVEAVSIEGGCANDYVGIHIVECRIIRREANQRDIL